jgi:3-oxoadipate enol-lactonase/4-carboxymuconolactone decarboxylase
VVETGGARLAYRLDGPAAAPVLVLANSLGTDLGMWAPQVAAFTAYFRLLRYDMRGHGASSAPPGPYTIEDLAADLVAILDHLGVGRASLCGLSLGGMVAMHVAARRPERVDRLVLACTAAELGPAESWLDRAALVRAEGTSVLTETLAARWFTPRFAGANGTVVASVQAMVAASDAEGYAACCEAIAAMDQRADLSHIAAPTLVLAGADDPVTTPATGLQLSAAIAGSALAVLADDAHLANLGQPDRFNAAVLDHLLGPAASRGAQARLEVLGAEHVARTAAAAGELRSPFLELVTRFAWGDVWSRPGLDRRTRSALTVALLAALGRHEELSFHVPAALRNGLALDELAEVLIHTAVYAGVPAANSAIAAAERALAAAGGPES